MTPRGRTTATSLRSPGARASGGDLPGWTSGARCRRRWNSRSLGVPDEIGSANYQHSGNRCQCLRPPSNRGHRCRVRSAARSGVDSRSGAPTAGHGNRGSPAGCPNASPRHSTRSSNRSGIGGYAVRLSFGDLRLWAVQIALPGRNGILGAGDSTRCLGVASRPPRGHRGRLLCTAACSAGWETGRRRCLTIACICAVYSGGAHRIGGADGAPGAGRSCSTGPPPDDPRAAEPRLRAHAESGVPTCRWT
jgi:hypothetical protein